MISPGLCLKCKGRLFCGNSKCFVLEKFSAHKKVSSKVKGTEFSGNSPPSIFVSWHNYPKINLAPLSPPEHLPNASFLDEPDKWFGLPEEKILSFREQLIRSTTQFDVDSASNPDSSLTTIQEMVMAEKPVEVEIQLKHELSPVLSFNADVAPLGPKGELKKFSLTENPSIPSKVDYLVSDTAIKSMDALLELYDQGFSVSFLTKLLSAGLLGVKKDRKLVPTRWSITAVDANLSKELIDLKVKDFPEINEFLLFHSTYLDNHFFVLLFPSSWCFEQLEAWKPGGAWTQDETQSNVISDHEFFGGRKDYADAVTGAYYAARLAVAEYLLEQKKQAGCIIFREIGSDYQLPLGVWQIRENVRNALNHKPLTFSDLTLALSFLEKKLSVPLKQYKAKSALLDFIQNQRKITEWT